MIKVYKKYEEVINYLIVGGLTTLVSVFVYALFTKLFHVNYMISNVISWVASVLFAYVTNKRFVFKSKCDNKRKVFVEIYQFFKYRVLSFVIDILLMYVFVELFGIDDMIAKVIVQVIVIVLNYVFSKLFVFKK
ncbi:MAG: GtrA family protein [Bacilli bacterium]|nr:GtrA family protein [Bacilli bacterium]